MMPCRQNHQHTCPGYCGLRSPGYQDGPHREGDAEHFQQNGERCVDWIKKRHRLCEGQLSACVSPDPLLCRRQYLRCRFGWWLRRIESQTLFQLMKFHFILEIGKAIGEFARLLFQMHERLHDF